MYIEELTEDWSSVNTVRHSLLKEMNHVSLNKETGGEFWVKTNCVNFEIDWLADTGSPRSFMQESTARGILFKHPSKRITAFTEKTKYKRFNNQVIQINGVLHVTLKSGSWQPKTARYD